MKYYLVKLLVYVDIEELVEASNSHSDDHQTPASTTKIVAVWDSHSIHMPQFATVWRAFKFWCLPERGGE